LRALKNTQGLFRAQHDFYTEVIHRFTDHNHIPSLLRQDYNTDHYDHYYNQAWTSLCCDADHPAAEPKAWATARIKKINSVCDRLHEKIIRATNAIKYALPSTPYHEIDQQRLKLRSLLREFREQHYLRCFLQSFLQSALGGDTDLTAEAIDAAPDAKARVRLLLTLERWCLEDRVNIHQFRVVDAYRNTAIFLNTL